MHKVGIIGLGFVGTAVETGFQSIADIKIYDKYKPSDSLESTVKNSNILFVCLPTPMLESGECDISIIEKEIDNIASIASKSKIIILKSTVPPGTTDRFQDKYPKHTFIFNPEFLTEKNFINDFLEQDRIILGTSNIMKDSHNKNILKVYKLYDDFIKTQGKPATIFDTSCKIAEMIKYIANCFLATKVMFFNEIYEICKAANIPFEDAVGLACMDERIGQSHSKVPGPDGQLGFGLSCFPKDLNSLMFFAKQLDVDPMILETVWTKNLLVRKEYDWEKLAQCNGNYTKQF